MQRSICPAAGAMPLRVGYTGSGSPSPSIHVPLGSTSQSSASPTPADDPMRQPPAAVAPILHTFYVPQCLGGDWTCHASVQQAFRQMFLTP